MKPYREKNIMSNRARYERDFPINWDFFSIPSHALYYFLGYLAGDGGAWSGITGVKTVSVGSTDGYIIEKFRDLIAPNNKVGSYFYNCKDGSKGICFKLKIDQLRFWSVVNAFDVKSPSIFQRVPIEFMSSFVLGFMDAEAHVEVINGKTCSGLVVSFYQKSKVYLEALDVIFRIWSLDPAPIYCQKNDCHKLHLRLEDSLKLLSILYASKGDLYLRRKFAIYESVLLSRGGQSVSDIHLNSHRRAWETRRVNIAQNCLVAC